MTPTATLLDLEEARRSKASEAALSRIFYVSRSLIKDGYEVQDIVQVSRSRNAGIDVTGVLAFSGDHFAQLLEGALGDLEDLMRSIRRDPRHSLLWEWPLVAVDERWYPQWAMGYLYNDALEDLVTELTQAPSLPGLDDFVRELFAGADLNKRSLT